jgi:hypothetical protein
VFVGCVISRTFAAGVVRASTHPTLAIMETRLGRGSYLGGHSLLGKDGSFSTYDPAAPFQKDPKASLQRKLNLQKKKKRKMLPNLEQQRKHLLNVIADRALSKGNKRNLAFPKNIGPDLREEVESFGGFEEWAAHQPDFGAMVEKKRGKKEAKNKKTGKKSLKIPSSNQGLSAPSAARDGALDRINFLKSEIREAKRFVGFAEREIAKLQRDLP